MRIFLYIIFFISFTYSETLNVSNIETTQSVDYISYITDENYTYEDIMDKKDIFSLEKKNLKNSNKTYWTKLIIKNDTNYFKELVLYNNLSGMNKIDVYIIKNNKLDKNLLLGDLREHNLREFINRYSSFILHS